MIGHNGSTDNVDVYVANVLHPIVCSYREAKSPLHITRGGRTYVNGNAAIQ